MNNSVSVLLIPSCRQEDLHKTAINSFSLPITADVQKYLLLCYGKQSMSILNYFHFNTVVFCSPYYKNLNGKKTWIHIVWKVLLIAKLLSLTSGIALSFQSNKTKKKLLLDTCFCEPFSCCQQHNSIVAAQLTLYASVPAKSHLKNSSLLPVTLFYFTNKTHFLTSLQFYTQYKTNLRVCGRNYLSLCRRQHQILWN